MNNNNNNNSNSDKVKSINESKSSTTKDEVLENQPTTKYLHMPEIKDDYDRAKYSLILDFPSCFQTINSAIECDKRQGKPPGIITKKCQDVHAHMNFCLLSTFCPDESRALMECTQGKIPQDGVAIPKKCQMAWNLFDECLINRTLLFEEEQKIAAMNNNNNNNINSLTKSNQ
ncbi:hypothetical protein PPL_09228 [Heterostelium album PN500]|uniref:Uncharacterized protein n=1 Tax=Heterostelium pallidum (strain ATCC 26659 / Pp 5 / PN500) TaxID=670386 RepID=D3BKZ6_HETP5|nr:hypothetical protein PPL_09228 [Heterostelium album PN500]EFA78576.1 hypothetical protein PPL_09228 [Heterostelium album PN500]|eukprot:XP_020430700.1 hypothetical protein PPL_09228 [Heterostelium album PN500]